MLKKRSAHNKYAGKSHLPVPGVFTRISHFKQIFVQKQKPIEDESDEEEDRLEESDDNCSDSGSEVSYSDLEDDDCSEPEIDGNF